MKKFITILTALAIGAVAFAQKALPEVSVVTAKGDKVSIQKIVPQGKPVVLSFWDTSCKPCIQEMGALSDVYDDWMDEFDFEVVAVSTDDARSSSKAIPLAKGRGWPFVVVLDSNSDLKRAMNVQSNPTVFVLDKHGKVVYSHIGYTPGSEQQIHDVLKSLK
ncbi:MAG: TlpA family protein disulfide reductase [Bacteroidales bacterium]|nr:TlpA family protein disulfide reductase [Bacteroidales bacterium]